MKIVQEPGAEQKQNQGQCFQDCTRLNCLFLQTNLNGVCVCCIFHIAQFIEDLFKAHYIKGLHISPRQRAHASHHVFEGILDGPDHQALL